MSTIIVPLEYALSGLLQIEFSRPMPILSCQWHLPLLPCMLLLDWWDAPPQAPFSQQEASLERQSQHLLQQIFQGFSIKSTIL